MRYKWRASDFRILCPDGWKTLPGWKYGRFGVNSRDGGWEGSVVMCTVLTHIPTGRKILDSTDAALAFEVAELLEDQLDDEVLGLEDAEAFAGKVVRVAPWLSDGSSPPWVDEDAGLGL